MSNFIAYNPVSVLSSGSSLGGFQMFNPENVYYEMRCLHSDYCHRLSTSTLNPVTIRSHNYL